MAPTTDEQSNEQGARKCNAIQYACYAKYGNGYGKVMQAASGTQAASQPHERGFHVLTMHIFVQRTDAMTSLSSRPIQRQDRTKSIHTCSYVAI